MKLSISTDRMRPHYDVVVVGSGYGGGIAASRLACAGKSVCVLERGRERQAGEYPRTELELARDMQIRAGAIHVGTRTGLFDLHLNKDINVIVGCGLGGTSLINAGIAVRPDPRVLQDIHWPEEIRRDASLDRYFLRAQDMLKPAVYPDTYPPLARKQTITECAQRLGARAERATVLVNFETLPNGVNHVGVPQPPCNGCGDCVSGCNYGSKNTVLMNYLPDARNHGAEIFTEIAVHRVERVGNGWQVICETTGTETQSKVITADIVILAAGTLGSTEILLRSREHGLSLSNALGTRFSGNGDTIGFAYDCDRPVEGVGFGSLDPGDSTPVGPCSTMTLDMRAQRPLEEGLMMEDGTIPGALSKILAVLLAAGARLTGTDTDGGLGDKLREWSRELLSKIAGPRRGAVRNTLFMLVVGHDNSNGTLHLDNDRLGVAWPDVGLQPHFARASDVMHSATAALGGTYIPNPVWNTLTHHNLITGHPLGGCPMADDPTRGVVNHKGQVYRSDAPGTTHKGLYVMDGSIIPRSLGVNPLLTISALAERGCEQLIQDYGWANA